MIKIIIKSFFSIKINSFLNFFLKNLRKKYLFLGPFFLPKKIEKFTLLNSPFIDKKSRDQLEIKRYKTILFIKNFDFYLINFILKNKFIDGLEINFFFL